MTTVLGLEEVAANLNREILKIKRRSQEGLVRASIIVRRDMDKTSPLIPIDLGNLRASWIIASPVGNRAESPTFVGPDAAKLKIDHETVLAEAEGIAKMNRPPVVVIGFTTNYAKYVHEMVGTKGKPINWSRPGSGPWFFSAAIHRNHKLFVDTVKKYAKVR